MNWLLLLRFPRLPPGWGVENSPSIDRHRAFPYSPVLLCCMTPPATGRRFGRTTINAAVCFLAVVVAAQVVAIVWALVRREIRGAREQPAAGAESSRVEAADHPRNSEPLRLPSVVSPAPPPAAATSSTPVDWSLDTPLPHNALYFLESGLACRQRGDMKSALTQLRAACDLLPTHPRLLYELATAYEKMALPDKAAEVWDRILKLGPGAGHFFKLAEMKFESGAGKAPREIETPLQLGKVLARRDGNPSVLEQMTLRIPVQAKDGAAIDPGKVQLDVLFYDVTHDGKVSETGAEVTPGRWLSGAPQWLASPVEFLELTYQQPKLPAVGGRAAGRRYFGYVIKLYYNDQLQDVLAEPKQLANRAHEPGERSLENGVERPQLEDSLFPLPVK
jgi:tetratricopeptide (TPR) repeat protein